MDLLTVLLLHLSVALTVLVGGVPHWDCVVGTVSASLLVAVESAGLGVAGLELEGSSLQVSDHRAVRNELLLLALLLKREAS